MHYDNNFKLYSKIMQFDKYLRRYVVVDIPSVHRDLKIRLLDESYNLIRYMFEAEFNRGNIRVKYIVEMLVIISMIDFILYEVREIPSANKKHINGAVRLLTEVKNMTYSWRKNPEPNEKNDTYNIYDAPITLDNLYKTFDIVRKTCKNKRAIYRFSVNKNTNIYNIYMALKLNKYKPLKYTLFMIFEPKERLVMSQCVSDKIVNHFVANYYLLPYLEKKLINTNVATRRGMGSSKGIKYLEDYINVLRMKNPNKEIYCLNIDISKYFYNVDHNLLINMLKKDIKDMDVINIIKVILDETNGDYINDTISFFNNKYNTSIPFYKMGCWTWYWGYD